MQPVDRLLLDLASWVMTRFPLSRCCASFMAQGGGREGFEPLFCVSRPGIRSNLEHPRSRDQAMFRRISNPFALPATPRVLVSVPGPYPAASSDSATALLQ